MPRTGKAFNLYLTEEERAGVDALALRNGRSVHDEIRHALQRHLKSPPLLEVPDLDEERMPVGHPPQPKRPVGRPKKASAEPFPESEAEPPAKRGRKAKAAPVEGEKPVKQAKRKKE